MIDALSTSTPRSGDPPAMAVVGCGRMGSRFHVPALAVRDDVELRALVDARREEAERLAARYGVEIALPTIDDLAASGVTAAIVAVPNRLHAKIAVELLAQGIDLLIEKPLATTIAECVQIQEAARRADRVVATSLPLRFSRAARLAKDFLSGGGLGQITGVQVEYGSSFARPTATDRRRQRETFGGGVLIERGSHILDLLVWWLGEITVSGYRDDAHGGVEADCIVDLQLPGGGRGRVELSWTRDLSQVAILQGELGTLEIGLGHNRVAWRADAGKGTLAHHSLIGSADGKPDETLADLVSAVHDNFIATLTGETEPGVSAAEATRSVKLIEECYRCRQRLMSPWVAPARSKQSARRAPSGLRDARVLVTGASGFIGGRLIEELIETHGAEVRALARPTSRVARLLRFPVDLRWGSVTDAQAVADAAAGCDIVFNCAHDTGSRMRNMRTGVGGTQAVADAAARAGVRRLVHLSSVVVYGETADGDLTEASPWGRTTDPYTLAKRRGERIIETAHEKGVPSVILQPTKVYGPWGKRWTAECARQMLTGIVPLVDEGRGLCNAVYVDDVVEAILLAATVPGAAGQRFLISAREPVTWRDFYAGFETAVGHTATVWVPVEALAPLARAERRRARRQLIRRTGSCLRSIITDSDAQSALRSLPSAQFAIALIERAAGAEGWERLKSRVVGGGIPTVGAERRRVHLPGSNVVASQRTRTRVRITHAEHMLGYDPCYDLDEGMRATAAFLRWARLVDEGIDGLAGRP